MNKKESNSRGSSPRSKLKRTLMLLTLCSVMYAYLHKAFAGALFDKNYLAHSGFIDRFSDSWLMWIGPVHSLGQILGAFLGGTFGDLYGRKSAFYVGIIASIVSIGLLTASSNLIAIIIGRVFQGMAIGVFLQGFQLYTSEIASPKERASLSAANTLTVTLFELLGVSVAYGLTYVETNIGWRLSFLVALIPISILAFLIPNMSESPRWLLSNRGEKAARASLERYSNDNSSLPSYSSSPDELTIFKSSSTLEKADTQSAHSDEFEAEFDRIKKAVNEDEEQKNTSYLDLFRTPANRYRSFIALSMTVWMSWNSVTFFSVYFALAYNAAGFHSLQTINGLQIVQAVILTAFSVVGMWTARRYGRRAHFLTATGASFLLLLIKGTVSVICLNNGQSNIAAGVAFLVLNYLLSGIWIASFKTVYTAYISEIFPTRLRTKGFILWMVSGMILIFLCQFTAVPLFKFVGGYIWFIYSGIQAAGFLTVYLTYPETKDKTLEDIDQMFEPISSSEKQ